MNKNTGIVLGNMLESACGGGTIEDVAKKLKAELLK